MKDKFEESKQKKIEENEIEYGDEIRAKYGEEAVEQSYNRVKNMTLEEQAKINKLWDEILQKLESAFEKGDPASSLAQEAVDLHRQWLSFYWGWYSKEAHINMGNMYVEDERFKQNYDSKKPGTAEFLRDAINIYATK